MTNYEDRDLRLSCCAGIECPDPGEVSNGEIKGTAPYYVGNAISVCCDDGYSLLGGSPIYISYCLDDGTWSTMFSCLGLYMWPVLHTERIEIHI